MVRGSIVVGIGINLARAPKVEGRKTAAIADAAPPPVLETFAASLAAAFDRRLESWRTFGLAATLQAFLTHSIHVQGSHVTVHDTDGSILTGCFAGLEETDGALRLRLADGSERVIRAGDIS
jgi:BirA family transcriptional regulator, biotin operon repressor / biotin---[acetyl-CoA-carboxylase] ligase